MSLPVEKTTTQRARLAAIVLFEDYPLADVVRIKGYIYSQGTEQKYANNSKFLPNWHLQSPNARPWYDHHYEISDHRRNTESPCDWDGVDAFQSRRM